MSDACNRLSRGHRKQSGEMTASDCLEAQTKRESQDKQTKQKAKKKTQNGQQRYNSNKIKFVHCFPSQSRQSR